MALGKELGEDNIRVNCIGPGLIKSCFSELVSVTECVATIIDGLTKIRILF